MYFIVYKVTCLVTGMVYVGQTTNEICFRWKGHCSKNSKIPYLSKAIKKYGKDNFKIEEIDGANSQSELNYKEWLWIYKLDCIAPNGYNLKEGGSSRGKWSKEYKEYMRSRGFWKSRIPWNKGKEHKPTLETIMKRGIAMKGREPWNKNIKMTFKQKEKIVEASEKRLIEYGPNKISIQALKNFNKKKSKPIQCTICNKKYISISEASTFLHTSTSNICKNLKGKISFISGCNFRYLGDIDRPLDNTRKKGKKILFKNVSDGSIIIGYIELGKVLNLSKDQINYRLNIKKDNNFLILNNIEILDN